MADFVPLVADPPPRLFATWWLRYLLFLAQLVGLAVVLLTEYSGAGEIRRSTTAGLPYLLAATMLVCWSALAMTDARRLVPATSYQRASSGPLVVVLWLLAFAAPIGGFRAVEWARDRFADDPDDALVIVTTVGAVLVCFVLVWLPFHYHTIHARRIGAPARIVSAWFWLPVVAGIGALLISALGLARHLERQRHDRPGTHDPGRRRVRPPGAGLRAHDVAGNDRVRRGRRPALAALAGRMGADAALDGGPATAGSRGVAAAP